MKKRKQKCKKKKYKKGDWAIFEEIDCGDEKWIRLVDYTLRHKIRLFIGIHGIMQDGSYLFDIPFETKIKWLNRLQYKFMYYIGNPVLNFIIGYRKLK